MIELFEVLFLDSGWDRVNNLFVTGAGCPLPSFGLLGNHLFQFCDGCDHHVLCGLFNSLLHCHFLLFFVLSSSTCNLQELN